MSAIISAHSLRLALALLAVHSGPHTIHRMLKAGDSDRYSMKMVMDQRVNVGAAGNQSIVSKFEAQYVLNVTKVNGASGTAQAEMTATTTKAEMGGMMGNRPIPTPKPIHESGVLDSQNRFKPSQVDNAIVSSFLGVGGGGASQSRGLLIELPDHAVNLGDSWRMDVAGLSQLGPGNHKLTVTLVGPGQVRGHAVWKVKLSGHMPISIDLNKLLGGLGSSGSKVAPSLSGLLGSMSMSMAGSMDYSGTGAVDQKTGKTATIDYVVASDMTMHMTPNQGAAQPINMKISGTSTYTLKLEGY